MSYYADYLRERTNDLIIETDKGFATYRYIDERQVYIIDIFIAADFRQEGAASELADLIVTEAKTKGCTVVLGTVCPSTRGSDSSIKVLQAYGMKLLSASNDVIIFKKDI